jgi:hypothetical protein
VSSKLIKLLLVFSLAIFNLVAIDSAKADTLSRCLEFNGKNYAEAPSKIVPLGGNFTVEMWVYPEKSNLGSFAEFISQGTQPYAFYMGLDPKGFLRLGDTWMSTGVSIKSEVWTHIAFTHDTNNRGRLFINGILVGSNVSDRPFNTAGNNTRFGAGYWPIPNEFFKGCLDEVRIWDTIRTNDEIRFNKDRLGISTQTAGLVASYSFDILIGYKNAQKTIIPDESKNYPDGSAQYKSLTFSAPGGTLALHPRGNFVPKSGIEKCEPQKGKFQIVSSKNLPAVLSVNGRTVRQTSIDVSVSGLPVGACVGFDTFVSGTTEPLSSTVAILSVPSTAAPANRFVMNLDTSFSGCTIGKSQIEVRGWWSDGQKTSQYGPAYKLPGCGGNIAITAASLLTDLTSVSLVGEDGRPSAWRAQTNDRLKFGKFLPAATRVNNLVNDPIQDLDGCHSLLKIGILQKIQEGLWVDVKNFDQWVLSQGCRSPTPYQPVVNASLPDTTVLRWKVSNGENWEYVSSPFIRQTGAVGTPSVSDLTNDQIKKLEQPTSLAFTVIGKDVVIKVVLPPTTRSRVQEVNLTAPTLGYPVQTPLLGKIEGGFGVFRIPISKLAGKTGKHTVKIDSRGSGVTTSKELVEVIDLSKYLDVPKPVTTKVTPKPKAPVKPPQVTCLKGAIVRNFDGKVCPPGYKPKAT